MRRLLFLLVIVTIMSVPVHAQMYKPWEFHLGLGYPQSMGATDKAADGKYHILFGAIKNYSPNLGLRIDGEYTRFDASDEILAAYDSPDGHAEIWSGSLDAQYNFTPGGRANFYVFGGVGTHYKKGVLTSPGVGWICDPWWGVCYPVGVDVVTGKKTDTGFGANGGAGIGFPISSGGSWFIEAKYQWINGDAKDIEYVPVTIGVRW